MNHIIAFSINNLLIENVTRTMALKMVKNNKKPYMAVPNNLKDTANCLQACATVVWQNTHDQCKNSHCDMTTAGPHKVISYPL